MDDLNSDFSDLLSPHRHNQAGASSMYVDSSGVGDEDDLASNPFAELRGNPSTIWASASEAEASAPFSTTSALDDNTAGAQEPSPASEPDTSDEPVPSSSSSSHGHSHEPESRPSEEVPAVQVKHEEEQTTNDAEEETASESDRLPVPGESQPEMPRTPTPAEGAYSALVSPLVERSAVDAELRSSTPSTATDQETAKDASPANTLLNNNNNDDAASVRTVPLSRDVSEASSLHSDQTAAAIHQGSDRGDAPLSEDERSPTQPFRAPPPLNVSSHAPYDASQGMPDTPSESQHAVKRDSSPLRHSSASSSASPRQQQAQPPPESDRPNYLITVCDPQKIGSDMTGTSYILYTIKSVSSAAPSTTRSVLRRFNDFLWLYDTLCGNNPGCIVPPPPEKHAIGRFVGDFVEQRRKGLQVFLGKVAAHPMLWNDPDFSMFLTSDNFALDIRHRPAPAPPTTPSFSLSGFLSSGPRFVEPSELITARQAAVAALEPSLRSLTASLQAASKARATVSTSVLDLGAAVAALEECGLSTPAKRTLRALQTLHETTGEVHKQLSLTAEADLVAVFDSWVRLASTSVKHALNARLKLWQTWQKQVALVRTIEKKRDAGQSSLQSELHEASLKAEQCRAEFEDSTKLIGAELVRFEVERAEDFRLALSAYVDVLCKSQQEIVAAWETYHEVVVDLSGTNNTKAQASPQRRQNGASQQQQEQQEEEHQAEAGPSS